MNYNTFVTAFSDLFGKLKSFPFGELNELNIYTTLRASPNSGYTIAYNDTTVGPHGANISLLEEAAVIWSMTIHQRFDAQSVLAILHIQNIGGIAYLETQEIVRMELIRNGYIVKVIGAVPTSLL